MHSVFATETCWATTVKIWKLEWILLKIILRSPQSNCQDFLRQCFNQQVCFCTWLFEIHIFFFHRFFKNLIGLNCQSSICVRCFFVLELIVFLELPAAFLHQDVNRQFLIVNSCGKRNKILVALSRTLSGWEFQNLHTHVFFSWDSNSSDYNTTD